MADILSIRGALIVKERDRRGRLKACGLRTRDGV